MQIVVWLAKLGPSKSSYQFMWRGRSRIFRLEPLKVFRWIFQRRLRERHVNCWFIINSVESEISRIAEYDSALDVTFGMLIRLIERRMCHANRWGLFNDETR